MVTRDKVKGVKSRWMTAARHTNRSLAVCLSFVLAACSTPAVKEEKPEPEEPVQSKAAPRPNLKVAAVGDIMLGSDFPKHRLPADDVSLLTPVAEVLRSADITFGNLEGVLQDGGEPVKHCNNPASCYLFRTPARYAEHLKEAGFVVMSLANNHARDFGEQGRDSSMANLQQMGIAHTGRDGDYASLTVNGLRVGVIAFAPYQGSNNMLDEEEARRRVEMLDAEHDIVIVSFHGGAEGANSTRIPFDREIYHGEDRGDVVEFARMAVDAGADLVLGHGPHVPRALELYQERLIAYSLGNFATYWGINISGVNGLAPILNAELSAEGKFLDGRIVSARQMRPGGTVPDEKHAAARMIRELTLSDFPHTPLDIDQRGNIRLVMPTAVSGAPPATQPNSDSPAIVRAE